MARRRQRLANGFEDWANGSLPGLFAARRFHPLDPVKMLRMLTSAGDAVNGSTTGIPACLRTATFLQEID
jgi:hypothetical protein